MVLWLYPLALVGLAAAVGPLLVHLLRRRHAAPMPFPTIRFVRAASTAAVRLRAPSDLPLLLLRMAIVSGAAIALAQPVVVTSARRAVWNARVSRAVVVDTSASMAGVSAAAAAAAQAEARAATFVERVDAMTLSEGLTQAAAALSTAPPSRREIVVISDFQLGSIGAGDVAAVPAGMGLRFIRLGKPEEHAAFDGDVSLGAPGVPARLQRIEVTPGGTAVRLAAAAGGHDGLRLLGDGGSHERLQRTVARAGAPAPSPMEPLTLAFAGAQDGEVPGITDGGRWQPWMIRTLLRMSRDDALADAARAQRARARLPDAWVVARSAGGDAVLVGAPAGRELLLIAAAHPADYLAAVALRSALRARRGAPDWSEREVARIPRAQLAAWQREPPAVGPRDVFQTDGDGRAIWLAVLGLLGVETFVRRRRPMHEGSAYADAA
jgi:hypothetical protein